MEDEILRIVREQNKEWRELAREISGLAVALAHHEEILKVRSGIIENHADRLERLEARPPLPVPDLNWKPVAALASAVLMAMVIAMYLIAGGPPEGVKEMLP